MKRGYSCTRCGHDSHRNNPRHLLSPSYHIPYILFGNAIQILYLNFKHRSISWRKEREGEGAGGWTGYRTKIDKLANNPHFKAKYTALKEKEEAQAALEAL